LYFHLCQDRGTEHGNNESPEDRTLCGDLIRFNANVLHTVGPPSHASDLPPAIEQKTRYRDTPEGLSGWQIKLSIMGLASKLEPQIIGLRGSSTSSTGFDPSIAGLATSRQVSQIAVQFTPVSGLSLSIPAANVNVSGTFATWYLSTSSQAYGSMFTATIPFTLQGQVSGYPSLIDALESVTVTVSNTEGTSSAQTASVH
jgi:hypothetical protein